MDDNQDMRGMDNEDPVEPDPEEPDPENPDLEESCGLFGVLSALDRAESGRRENQPWRNRHPVITLERNRIRIQYGTGPDGRYEKLFYEIAGPVGREAFWRHWGEHSDLRDSEIRLLRDTLQMWGLTRSFGWCRED
jgi:hypothetical protein